MKLALVIISTALLGTACTTNVYTDDNRPNARPSGIGNNQAAPNIVGDWEGTFLFNHNIAITFTSNSAGTAVHRTGNWFARGPVTVSQLHSTNVVFRMHLVPDTNSDIYSEYVVTAQFENNQTVMRGTTVSGTQDFRVVRK